jgi:hypothetical protein
MAALLHVFSAHVEEAVGKIVSSEQPRACCLIADTFFVWPSTIAKKFGLCYVSFWTEPTLVFTLYYHLHLLRINGHYGCHGKRAHVFSVGHVCFKPNLSSYKTMNVTLIYVF